MDNFQRSFSVSDGNALTFNAYMVGKKWQRTTNNVLFAVSKNCLTFYFFQIFISGNFQRFKIEGQLVVSNFQRTTFNFQPSTDNF